jgi:hypothetical protein
MERNSQAHLFQIFHVNILLWLNMGLRIFCVKSARVGLGVHMHERTLLKLEKPYQTY